MVPDATGHLQRSCVVHAFMGQNCFSRKGPIQYLKGIFNVSTDQCMFYLTKACNQYSARDEKQFIVSRSRAIGVGFWCDDYEISVQSWLQSKLLQ